MQINQKEYGKLLRQFKKSLKNLKEGEESILSIKIKPHSEADGEIFFISADDKDFQRCIYWTVLEPKEGLNSPT